MEACGAQSGVRWSHIVGQSGSKVKVYSLR